MPWIYIDVDQGLPFAITNDDGDKIAEITDVDSSWTIGGKMDGEFRFKAMPGCETEWMALIHVVRGRG